MISLLMSAPFPTPHALFLSWYHEHGRALEPSVVFQHKCPSAYVLVGLLTSPFFWLGSYGKVGDFPYKHSAFPHQEEVKILDSGSPGFHSLT